MTMMNTATAEESSESDNEPAKETTNDPSKKKDALEVSILPQHCVIGTSTFLSTTHLCAHIQAPRRDDTVPRAPVDIVVALDLSGSTTEEQLSMHQQCLELLLSSLLGKDDRFGLVTFSDDAAVEIPLQKLSAGQKMSALLWIKRLKTTRGRGTNLSAATDLAAQEMKSVSSSPNPVRAVFLLTDGLANRGTLGCNVLVRKLQERLLHPHNGDSDAAPPITFHCFGCGPKHGSYMLKSLSQVTPGGTYYFVERNKDVLTAFGDALEGIFSVVAQNVVLHIRVPAKSRKLGVKVKKIHHKNVHQGDDNKSYSVHLGDVYANESRDVLLEVWLADKTVRFESWIPHAQVSLEYTNTRSKQRVCGKPVVCEIARIHGKCISAMNNHVKEQRWRSNVVEALGKAEKLASRGNLAQARAEIDRVSYSTYEWRHDNHNVDFVRLQQQLIFDSFSGSIGFSTEEVKHNPFVRQVIFDLARVKQGLDSEDGYVGYGSHRLRHILLMHETQRCMEARVSKDTCLTQQAAGQMSQVASLISAIDEEASYTSEERELDNEALNYFDPIKQSFVEKDPTKFNGRFYEWQSLVDLITNSDCFVVDPISRERFAIGEVHGMIEDVSAETLEHIVTAVEGYIARSPRRDALTRVQATECRPVREPASVMEPAERQLTEAYWERIERGLCLDLTPRWYEYVRTEEQRTAIENVEAVAASEHPLTGEYWERIEREQSPDLTPRWYEYARGQDRVEVYEAEQLAGSDIQDSLTSASWPQSSERSTLSSDRPGSIRTRASTDPEFHRRSVQDWATGNQSSNEDPVSAGNDVGSRGHLPVRQEAPRRRKRDTILDFLHWKDRRSRCEHETSSEPR